LQPDFVNGFSGLDPLIGGGTRGTASAALPCVMMLARAHESG